MPRIDADSVVEHVRQQTDRLLDVAGGLFKSRGYRATDMGLIAAKMGLARSSLYRYYANKDHILLACIQRDMAPLLDDFTALTSHYDDPEARVFAWLSLQIDIALSPDHAGLDLMGELRHADRELQEQIQVLHQQPAAVLQSALSELDRLSAEDIDVLSKMIAGMTHAAAMYVIEQNAAGHKNSEQRVRKQLRTTVAQILQRQMPAKN